MRGCPVPPVMITVANRTETAARIKYAFDHQRIPVPELCNPDLTLRIDSKMLDEAESATGKKADAAAALREMVDTVGQKGKPGEQIRNVISVGMLSEGWDAKTVTHILGLRAFSSQLLCEQVIGRGRAAPAMTWPKAQNCSRRSMSISLVFRLHSYRTNRTSKAHRP